MLTISNMQDADRRAVLCIEHILCLGVMTVELHIICLGVMTVELHIICLGVMIIGLHIICLCVMTVELYCVLSTLYFLMWWQSRCTVYWGHCVFWCDEVELYCVMNTLYVLVWWQSRCTRNELIFLVCWHGRCRPTCNDLTLFEWWQILCIIMISCPGELTCEVYMYNVMWFADRRGVHE